VASDLVALAGEQGIALTVRNLGVPGWTLWQEYQAVVAELAQASRPPDLIVFLDGYNDVVGTLVSSAVRNPQRAAPTVMDQEDVLAFFQVLPEIRDDLDASALGKLAASRYDDLRRLIQVQLSGLGVASAFFFQPDALTVPTQRQPVDRLYAGHPQAAMLDDLAVALETASRSLRPAVHDLRHLFDQEARPVFADSVHTNEAGASVVARAVFEAVRPDLRARAG
jgi:hypothetical protein